MGNEAKRFVGIDLSKRTYEAVAITVNPQTITRWNGKLDPRGRKCLLDKLHSGDTMALKLARLIEKYSPEELPFVPIPTDQKMERRALVAHEIRFRQDRVRLINRLHAVFLRAGFPDHTKRQLGITASREKLVVSELDGFNLAEVMNLRHIIVVCWAL